MTREELKEAGRLCRLRLKFPAFPTQATPYSRLITEAVRLVAEERLESSGIR